jgi:PAS domain S-box-containing protein
MTTEGMAGTVDTAPVPENLRILLVEDSSADAELLLRQLRQLQRRIEHRRVASEPGLVAALDEFAPDIVLSDYSMPGFGGQDALEIVLRRAPRVPFIFVSGTIGEERAIDALQRGAADYILKDNLRRLPASVDRALRAARERVLREQMEVALRESEERFRTLVETSQDWVWEKDAKLRLTYSNGAVEDILGYRPEELQGRRMLDLVVDDDRHDVEQRLPHLVRHRRGWQRWRLRWRHRDGQLRVLESTGHPMLDADGKVLGYRGIDTDITERLRKEARISRLARIHAVLSAVGTAVLRSRGREDLLLNACRVAVEKGGFAAAGIGMRDARGELHVARTYGDPDVLAVVAPKEPMPLDADSAYHDHPGLRAFRENRVVAVADFNRCDDAPEALCRAMLKHGVHSQIALPLGSEPWGVLALYSSTARDYDADEIALLQRLADDIDYTVDFIAKSERLRYLAHHNPVTGLPNRVAFQQYVAGLLDFGGVALVALNVQRFGHVINSRGREFAEALLTAIGQRLEGWMTGVYVANPEADTFLLAYPCSGTPKAEAEWLAGKLAAFEQHAFLLHGERIHATLRAGLAVGREHARQADMLERQAMAALAEAGELGVSLRGYDDALSERAERRLELERDLRRAIDEHQFELFFQPKFDCAGRRLAGAEALVRWRHPEKGLVSPAEFIPVLEDTGLVVPVGRWVMHEAVATAQKWRAHVPGLRLAVNVSARELRGADFLQHCRELLEPFGGAPPIDIEVTESVLMDDVADSVRLLQGLRDLGCKVAIDDFGTGYSALNYLVRLPIDTIKIDRSFVAMLGTSPETVSLVTHMINLARSLGLDVVAEGVEDEQQAQLLRILHCDVLQGYLLGRPVDAATFARDVLQA